MDIKDKAREGVEWRNFAILYRTNKQHGLFEAALSRRNIPYRVYKGMSLLEHKDVRNLIAYFSVILNPNDDESFKRIVNYPARGIGDTTIARIADIARQRNTSMWHAVNELVTNTQPMDQVEKVVVRKVADFVKLINELSSLRVEMGVCDFAKEVMTRSGILHMLEAEKKPENDTSKDYLDQLLAMMSSYEDECSREMEDGLRDEELTPSVDEWMQSIMLQTDQDSEDDGNRVTLMTVHSAKGLEYDYVYIVGMEDGLFPSSRSIESIADLEEERRLMYVAITRAKKGVMLSFSEMRRVWGKTENTTPSRFLKEIEEEYLDANFDIEELSSRNRWDRALDDDNRRPKFESLKSRYGAANTTNKDGRRVEPSRPRPEVITTPPPMDPKRAGMRSVGVRSAEGASATLGACNYAVGERVAHPKFGPGTVERIEPLTTDHKLVINFDSYGSKTLLAEFAKLTKL
jgi:DNA helicase-2/ATP-dependent DNA helicase PcrA